MMSAGMCTGHKVAYVLIWVGAINWGLIGFFNFNLVHYIFSASSTAERVVYAAVGLSAVFMLFMKSCSMCKMAK